MARMERALLDDLGDAGVEEAHFVVAFDEPYAFTVWLGTATDVQRDALLGDTALEDRVRTAARTAGLADLLDGFRVDSQETVDRDYAGNWFHRLR